MKKIYYSFIAENMGFLADEVDDITEIFTAWLRRVGNDSLIIDDVIAEVDYDDEEYKLSGSKTKSGNSEIFKLEQYRDDRVEAICQKFSKELRTELERVYPDADIEIEYMTDSEESDDDDSSSSTRVWDDDVNDGENDDDESNYIDDHIAPMVLGNFW